VRRLAGDRRKLVAAPDGLRWQRRGCVAMGELELRVTLTAVMAVNVTFNSRLAT